MEAVKKIYEAVKGFNPCELFKGDEDFNRMMEIFTSPQGIEFCLKHNVLNSAVFEAIEGLSLARWGVYVDAGQKRLQNERLAVLIGDCDFDLEYDTLVHPCKVVLFNGARARVKASGYSVVRVEKQDGCECEVTITDSAIVR